MIFVAEFGYVEYTPEYTDTLFDDDGDEYESDPYTLIDLVYVRPEYRGNGNGRKLLTSALKEILALGKSVKLCANPKENCMSQTDLVAFYGSCGFSLCDEQGADSVFMEICQ